MEKRKPHYPLDAIKAAFADLTRLNRTNSAMEGAADLEMDDENVVEIIGNLSQNDFDKSTTSHSDHTVWQDVYRPLISGRSIYVKFTLDHQRSFC